MACLIICGDYRHTYLELQSKTKGFTLIELLVVLAVISLLLTISVPRYYNQVDRAAELILRENLKVTRDILDKFYGDSGRYPDSLDELVELRYLRSLPYDPILRSSQDWIVIPPPRGLEGKVYDLKSASGSTARDGSNYANW